MKLEVTARVLRGNATEITHDEAYDGPVFIDAHQDGTLTLMKPTSYFAAMCEEHRRRGIPEPRPLDRLDHRERDLIVCGKRDAALIHRMDVGAEIELPRRGWGIIVRNRVRRVE
jgi:hypothetical protein